jgi:hypothetical protein
MVWELELTSLLLQIEPTVQTEPVYNNDLYSYSTEKVRDAIVHQR